MNSKPPKTNVMKKIWETKTYIEDKTAYILSYLPGAALILRISFSIWITLSLFNTLSLLNVSRLPFPLSLLATITSFIFIYNTARTANTAISPNIASHLSKIPSPFLKVPLDVFFMIALNIFLITINVMLYGTLVGLLTFFIGDLIIPVLIIIAALQNDKIVYHLFAFVKHLSLAHYLTPVLVVCALPLLPLVAPISMTSIALMTSLLYVLFEAISIYRAAPHLSIIQKLKLLILGRTDTPFRIDQAMSVDNDFFENAQNYRRSNVNTAIAKQRKKVVMWLEDRDFNLKVTYHRFCSPITSFYAYTIIIPIVKAYTKNKSLFLLPQPKTCQAYTIPNTPTCNYQLTVDFNEDGLAHMKYALLEAARWY